ncbi:extracellular solute-binding protein [Allonocardiopsis opalescens]|uniref:Carbohydrate ABC transporter substrate-binding protein (CUT1 family) n=1 Tax=Allonocardiopsis opalescens TaxID=1144618 RepID=A0A2T0PZK6_9ACTN|nr:extracellular solute-binding protein [Allonocardiopsis opalescens]PRX96847.1 carbohydrate ABC transporter substrate-binding protein (CUT1 family) [Allonocardiopsis opalescens]
MAGRPGGAGVPPGPLGRPLSRRGLIAGGLALAGTVGLGGALAGCGAGGAGAQSRIRFWSPLTGGDGALMEEMIAAVERRAAEIDVDSTVLAWGPPYYTKLAMSSVGGRAPEVGVMHLSRLTGYAPGGLLHPFDLGMLAEFGLTEDQLNAGLRSRSTHDGEVYAIPLDSHPFIAFYDTDIADRAGLLDTDGRLREFESPEDFVAASRELAAASGDQGVAFGYVNDDSQSWRLFLTLYTQAGATIEFPPGGEPVFDPDAALRVFRFLAELLDGQSSPNNLDYFGALAGFADGRAGVLFTGEWELPYLRETQLALGAAPFPTIFEQPANYADAHAFVLPRQSEPDPERVRATHRFVALILRESLTWAQAGHIPAYLPILELPEYGELRPQVDYAVAGERVVLDPPAWFAGAGSEFHTQTTGAMSTALTGAGPEAAVEQLSGVLTAFANRQNPTEGDR